MPTRVVMMGAFPPPIGGAAKVNGIVYEALRDAGADVRKIDLAAASLAHNRTLAYHAQRLGRNIAGAIRARRDGTTAAALYIVPDGGAGAWYSLGHLSSAGGKYDRIALHHHTCRYIDHHSRPIDRIARIHADRTVHIFLTQGMADAFQRRYGVVRYMIASNARFVADEAALDASARDPGPVRLGHLSNLCRDKGFFAVADAYDATVAAGHSVTLTLAGPILEAEVATRLAALNERHGNRICHLGAVDGEAKRAFYRSIDLFLFPTQWKQEAAPIVVYEALSAGVPVLATDRGVIREIVGGSGVVCRDDADFIPLVVDRAGVIDLGTLAAARRASAIKADIRRASAASVAQYDALLAMLTRTTPSGVSVASS